MSLRDYLVDMNRLYRDFMTENNHGPQEQLLESFKLLHVKIEGYLKHATPSELASWNEPFSSNSLGIAAKEDIERLEDIVNKYEGHGLQTTTPSGHKTVK